MIDEDAPSQRSSWLMPIGKLAYHRSTGREPSGHNDDRPCADLPDCSLAATGITSSALVVA
ncbi:hypothetical protein [Pseudonocardia sp. TMWB2A]|uniref:hypothetical protein n=1 Tax=Pseudonocardia sp. TMWB2A TaxID=687430 RepID=UPI00307F507F